jgi:hypothetical protein
MDWLYSCASTGGIRGSDCFQCFRMPGREQCFSCCGSCPVLFSSNINERALFNDRSGTLWVGCDQFVDRYDPATETFSHYRLGDRRNDQPPVRVFSLSQDRAGAIWVSTDDGLYRLDATTGRKAHFGHDSTACEAGAQKDSWRRGSFSPPREAPKPK